MDLKKYLKENILLTEMSKQIMLSDKVRNLVLDGKYEEAAKAYRDAGGNMSLRAIGTTLKGLDKIGKNPIQSMKTKAKEILEKDYEKAKEDKEIDVEKKREELSQLRKKTDPSEDEKKELAKVSKEYKRLKNELENLRPDNESILEKAKEIEKKEQEKFKEHRREFQKALNKLSSERGLESSKTKDVLKSKYGESSPENIDRLVKRSENMREVLKTLTNVLKRDKTKIENKTSESREVINKYAKRIKGLDTEIYIDKSSKTAGELVIKRLEQEKDLGGYKNLSTKKRQEVNNSITDFINDKINEYENKIKAFDDFLKEKDKFEDFNNLEVGKKRELLKIKQDVIEALKENQENEKIQKQTLKTTSGKVIETERVKTSGKKKLKETELSKVYKDIITDLNKLNELKSKIDNLEDLSERELISLKAIIVKTRKDYLKTNPEGLLPKKIKDFMDTLKEFIAKKNPSKVNIQDTFDAIEALIKDGKENIEKVIKVSNYMKKNQTKILKNRPDIIKKAEARDKKIVSTVRKRDFLEEIKKLIKENKNLTKIDIKKLSDLADEKMEDLLRGQKQDYKIKAIKNSDIAKTFNDFKKNPTNSKANRIISMIEEPTGQLLQKIK